MSDVRRQALVESPVPVLAVSEVDKSFPGVHALVKVTFECRAGEIHGLVGENGAGRSTLMRILAGVHRPDSGRIQIDGKGVTLNSPRHAHDLGIAMVYQDTRLVDELDLVQNIWLEREPGSALFVDRSEMERRSAAILQRLGIQIDLRRRVGELSVGERQIVEIARALTANPAVLILDEPTSSLDPAESEQLGKILPGLRTAGTGIVFISHRLPEVLEFADRITVMKDGEIVSTLENKGITEDTLVSLMVGRTLSLAFPPKTGKTGATRLEVESLASPGHFQNVSFSVAAAEIVGLGGIQGNGQREIARALYGLLPATGQVRLIGSRLYAIGSNPEAAFVAGIPVRRVRFSAYLFCGLMAALAGLVVAARIGSGDPQAGSQFTLASVTAVVVGGTSIFGGRGTVVGTLLGAILLILMQNSLNQLHVSAYYQYIWTGALMLLAVGAYSVHEHTDLSAQFDAWIRRNLRRNR
jgi:ABC-type sugar transport system ATPase subunit